VLLFRYVCSSQSNLMGSAKSTPKPTPPPLPVVNNMPTLMIRRYEKYLEVSGQNHEGVVDKLFAWLKSKGHEDKTSESERESRGVALKVRKNAAARWTRTNKSAPATTTTQILAQQTPLVTTCTHPAQRTCFYACRTQSQSAESASTTCTCCAVSQESTNSPLT
jgi:hypothetical protein